MRQGSWSWVLIAAWLAAGANSVRSEDLPLDRIKLPLQQNDRLWRALIACTTWLRTMNSDRLSVVPTGRKPVGGWSTLLTDAALRTI